MLLLQPLTVPATAEVMPAPTHRRCPPPLPSLHSYATVQPMADHSKLEVQEEGLAVLRGIKGKRTTDLPSDVAHEAIHRDDLMVLADRA